MLVDAIGVFIMKQLTAAILIGQLILFGGCASTGTGVETTGNDDQLETEVKFSTFSYDRPFMGIVNPWDYHLRGYRNKNSGLETYQLYIVTNSADWMYWSEARYLSDGQIRKTPVSQVGTDVQCFEYGCAHYEDSIITLSKEVLENWAASRDEIKLRLGSSRVSSTLDIGINPKEVSLFLKEINKKVSQY